MRIVGWWVGNTHSARFPIEKFPWDIYTHIKIGDPVINQNASVFCNKTDHNFHHIVKQAHKHNIKVRVWERGAGNTKACGTAACATAVAGKINGVTGSQTEIAFPLGNLSILIDKENIIHMTGPVSEIEEIKIKL